MIFSAIFPVQIFAPEDSRRKSRSREIFDKILFGKTLPKVAPEKSRRKVPGKIKTENTLPENANLKIRYAFFKYSKKFIFLKNFVFYEMKKPRMLWKNSIRDVRD